ncbi:hypothetical protein WA158_002365 [Blastocystis sp. Blastoise]
MNSEVKKDTGIYTQEGNVAGKEAAMMALQREKQIKEFEAKKKEIDEKYTNSIKPLNEQFKECHFSVMDHLAKVTVGLHSVEDYRNAREKLEHEKAAKKAKSKEAFEVRRKNARDKLDQLRDKHAQKLSFNLEGDDEEEEVYIPKKKCIQKKISKDPNIDIDLMNDKEKIEQEKSKISTYISEWEQEQERLKHEKLQICYSYYNGQSHVGTMEIERGATISLFLDKVRKSLSKQYADLASLSTDDLLYIKEDAIIPPTTSDVTIHEDDQHQSQEIHTDKVVDRRWTFSTSPKKFDVMFFGSDNVSLPSLEALHDDLKKDDGVVNSLEVVCTTMVKKNIKRKTKKSKPELLLPVEEYCKSNDIQYYPISGLKTLRDWSIPDKITSNQFNLLVCASFGYFIPKKIIESFHFGGINVHPSLLPKYRGPSPIISTLLNGDDKAGVSIITLDPKNIDKGDILMKKEIPISNTIQCPELTSILSTLGSSCLMNTLYNYNELTNHPEIQDPYIIPSYTKKITSEMSVVDFQQNNKTIYNLFRATSHLYPLKCTQIYTYNENSIMKTQKNTIILRDLYIPEPTGRSSSEIPVGTVRYLKRTKHLYIKCGCDSWIGVKSLQVMPKSNTIPAHVFVNQFRETNFFTKLE